MLSCVTSAWLILVGLPCTTQAQFIFEVSGKSTWIYAYYGQTGSNGFFGPYNIDNSLSGNFAGLNGWVGLRTAGQLVSGTNAATTQIGFDFAPKVQNDWAVVKGRYKIHAYETATAPGAEVPISVAQWTNWQVGARPPFGAMFFGKRDFTKGIGLQFSENRTSEHLLVLLNPIAVPDILRSLVAAGSVPMNLLKHSSVRPVTRPIRVKYCGALDPNCPSTGIQSDTCTGQNYMKVASYKDLDKLIFKGEAEECPADDPCPSGTAEIRTFGADGRSQPMRRESYGKPVAELDFADHGLLTLGFGFFPWEYRLNGTTVEAWNINDLGAGQRVNLLAYLEYVTTELSVGVGSLYTSFHQGPELTRTQAQRRAFSPLDATLSEGWLYLMYNNGRVAFSGELDWYNGITTHQASLAIEPPSQGWGSRYAPEYVESWRCAAELSVQAGPTVVSLFYSHMPGPDRRHGILIRKQPYIQDIAQTGLYLFQRYSTLMAYKYGSGVNSTGDMSDASVLAARMDHSIAANLNIFGSLMRATRVSHGYGWGFIRPNPDADSFGTVQYLVPTFVDYNRFIPAIPDRDLGWEAGVGMRWKLLANFELNVAAFYWKPGKWFNYACVDRTIGTWDAPTAANMWGINPNRTIDPVVSFEISVYTGW